MPIYDPVTEEINQRCLTEWGRDNVRKNLRPVLMISADNKDFIDMKSMPGLQVGQLAEMCEQTALRLRELERRGAKQVPDVAD